MNLINRSWCASHHW